MLAAVYIAGAAGLFANLLTSRGNATEPTSLTFLALWSVMLCLPIMRLPSLLILRRSGAVPILLMGLIGYLLLSSIWSTDPIKALTYSGVVAMNFLFATSLVGTLGAAGAIRLAGYVTIWLTIAGLALGLLSVPTAVYLDVHDRQNFLGISPLRGLSNHKITAAIYASYGALASLTLLRKWRWPAFSACVAMVVMAGSSTGLMALSVCLIFFCAFSITPARPTVRWGITAATVTSLMIGATIGSSFLFQALGRDPTLTGRTVLWEIGLRVWAERPFVGWGYVGFMDSARLRDFLNDYRSMANYDAPHFHSSYIQLLVEGGVPLLLGYLTLGLATLAQAFRFSIERPREGAFIAITITSILLLNFVSNTALRYNDFSSLFLMITVIALAEANRRSAVKEKAPGSQLGQQRLIARAEGPA
ncbi:O-antigen ligase family protein [Brevundimonas sp. VNH65]|uniref:O-antigen ligase family protein n=1 Tax=Brevundimonas sp. VNH65 TaxID=3400917 RepID=UPI003C074365